MIRISCGICNKKLAQLQAEWIDARKNYFLVVLYINFTQSHLVMILEMIYARGIYSCGNCNKIFTLEN